MRDGGLKRTRPTTDALVAASNPSLIVVRKQAAPQQIAIRVLEITRLKLDRWH